MFLDLPRPQYVANPELLQSALAWRCVGESKLAYIYGRNAETSETMEWVLTRPEVREHAEWQPWLDKVGEGFFSGRPRDSDQDYAARAILVAIKGIQQSGAKGTTAAPLTFHAALLQNARGVLGVNGPPPYGTIFDTLFALGNDGEEATASALWKSAVSTFPDDEGYLAKLDTAIKNGTKPLPEDLADIEPPNSDPLPRAPGWLESARASSPFHWFATTWRQLTSSQWRDALPPRRWCDWATCVLRTAIGICYFWESRFYRELAEGLITLDRPADAVYHNAVSRSSPLLAWDHEGAVSIRDVASHIRSTVVIGLNAKTFIEEQLLPEIPDLQELDTENPTALTDWIESARELMTNAARTDLIEALQGPIAGRHKNVIETIRSSLLCRESLGPHADLYALLTKPAGPRFTLVDPSPEWPVVIASLACTSPGTTTRLGDVMACLRQLGLAPSYDTLIYTLESAGLCQGSHDADEAVEVHSGF